MKIEKQGIKNIVLIVSGTLLLACGTAVFLLPNELICGGVSGVAIILGELFSELSRATWINILTIGLFLLGLFTLKSNFAMKTLLSTAVYPLGIYLFAHLLNNKSISGIIPLFAGDGGSHAVLFSSILGGIFVGTGCAITFLGGGSTGGVDIVALLLCKFFPRLRSSFVMFIIDALIILCGILLFGDAVKSLLGILSAFVAALMIEILYHKKGENGEK